MSMSCWLISPVYDFKSNICCFRCIASCRWGTSAASCKRRGGPQKGGFGVKMGGPIHLKGIYPPPKHVFWCIRCWATPFRVSWRGGRRSKNKKGHEVSTSPLRPQDTPNPTHSFTHFGPQTKFCIRAKFTEVINCAKFHLNRLSCFWALRVRKSESALRMSHCSYNSVVRTTVLHYIFRIAWPSQAPPQLLSSPSLFLTVAAN